MAARLVIPKELFETSNAWGFRASLRLLGVPLVFIALLPTFASISPWLAIATIAPLGIAISKTTLLVHEALHGTLFRTPLMNRIAGRLSGWWTVVDFVTFDALHRQHHAYVGTDDDPQLLDHGALQNATRAGLLWHLLRPLIGWNVQHRLLLIRERLRVRRPPLVALGEVTGLITVQTCFFLLATAGAQVL